MICELLGSFIIKVDKENAGEHFEGLDLLTKLLAPVGSSNASGRLIEVIGECYLVNIYLYV